QAAEEGVFIVGGPIAEDDAVDGEGEGGVDEEDADVELGDLEPPAPGEGVGVNSIAEIGRIGAYRLDENGAPPGDRIDGYLVNLRRRCVGGHDDHFPINFFAAPGNYRD